METIAKGYNVQPILLDNGQRYVTVRTDIRTLDEINGNVKHSEWYAKKGRAISPVLKALLQGIKAVKAPCPTHLQNLTKVQAKAIRYKIVEGYRAEFGDSVVLNKNY